MTTPDYQTLMLPVLQALSDGQEQPVRQLIERVADRVQISAEDRTELLPSGRTPRYVSSYPLGHDVPGSRRARSKAASGRRSDHR